MALAEGRTASRAAPIARVRSPGRNGFCRQTISACPGDLDRKSSAVMPDIATTGRAGTRSRLVAVRLEPFEPCVLECLQSRFGGCGFDDFEMVDPQHDRDHRPHIGLVVNDKNTGHEKNLGLVVRQPMVKMPEGRATPRGLFD